MSLVLEFKSRFERQNPRYTIPTSKGYPKTRDPQAQNPQGAMPRKLSDLNILKLRQRYDNNPK